MSVQNFIGEVWAKKIRDDLELKAQLVAHCTHEYQGDAKYGNSVRILGVGEPKVEAYNGTVTYEEMDDSKQDLPIDIREYFAFKVDDVDKAQSRPGLPEKYQQKAVRKLHIQRELKVGQLVAGKLLSTNDEMTASKGKTSDLAVIPYKTYYVLEGSKYVRVKNPVTEDISTYYEVTSGNFKEGAKNVTTASAKTQTAIKTAIDTALTNLRIRNNTEGGYVEIDPTTYMNFKNNLVELSTNNPEMIRRGVVGMYDGYEVTRTNAIYRNSTHQFCFAHSGTAIAFVGQIDEVEAMRLESAFSDGIRGLDVYGMKIVAQDEIEAIKIPV